MAKNGASLWHLRAQSSFVRVCQEEIRADAFQMGDAGRVGVCIVGLLQMLPITNGRSSIPAGSQTEGAFSVNQWRAWDCAQAEMQLGERSTLSSLVMQG